MAIQILHGEAMMSKITRGVRLYPSSPTGGRPALKLWKTFVSVFLLSIFLIGDSWANEAIVQVLGVKGFGSGVVLEWEESSEYFHVLTAAHVLRPLRDPKVKFESGQTVDAELVGLDTNLDLGLLKIKGFAKERYSLADSVEVGSEVLMCGYSKGILECRNGTLEGYQVDEHGNHDLKISGYIYGGDSGGPIFQGDKIIGIQTHAKFLENMFLGKVQIDKSIGTSLEQIRGFLTGQLGRCPSCPPVRRAFPIDPPKTYQVSPPKQWIPVQPNPQVPFDLSGIESRIQDLQLKNAALERIVSQLKAQQGEQGLPGLDGKPGDRGPVGPPGVVDYDELLKGLPPFVVEIVDEDGKVVKSQSVRLGESFQIPPFGIEIEDGQGKMLQSRMVPLGEKLPLYLEIKK